MRRRAHDRTTQSPSRELEALLDELAARADRRTCIPAAHGRTIEVDDDEREPALVQIRDRDGHIEIDLRITPDGPKLQLRGVALELVATRSVELRCETFRVEAELGASITAARGDVRLDAGDDVVVVGERIHLN